MCRYTAVALVLLCGSALFAVAPVAMLSSVGPVRVAGTEMSASTVALWPLVSGDRIEAISSPAIVILPDHSRVTISAGSSARIEGTGSSVSVHMLSTSTASGFSSAEGKADQFITLTHPISGKTPPVGGDNGDPRLPGLRH